MGSETMTLGATKVYPQAPYPKRFELSLADSTAPKDFALTHVLLWPQTGEISKEEVYSSLREGLARTVHEIPALCGTIETSPDGRKDLFIEIGEDAHVVFEFEDLSTIETYESYQQLEKGCFALSEVHSHFMPAVFKQPVVEGSPMTGTKLSIIKGGYALAFGVNHVLVDGTSASEIEHIWAQHASDASAGKQFAPYLADSSSRDLEIRQKLSNPSPNTQKLTDEHPLWMTVPADFSITRLKPKPAPPAESTQIVAEDGKPAEDVKSAEDIKAAEDLKAANEKRWYLWRFSQNNLESLKADATAQGSERPISTSNAFMGLFWSRLAAAQKHSSRGHKQLTALMPISMRPRFNPPIPLDFVGNAVSVAMAECNSADLEAEDGKSTLRAAAGSLRTAVHSWSVSDYESYIETVRALPLELGMGIRPQLVLEDHRVVFNDCSRFKCNTNDWGRGLGVAAPTRFPMPAGLIFGATSVVIHPRLPDGSLEVVAALTKSISQALENDPDFKRYAPQLMCVLPSGTGS